jgi:hypothetical protein
MVMKESLYWDITSFSLLRVNRLSGGSCRLHLQGEEKTKQESSKKEAVR